MDKDSIYELQKIECNCNDCAFMVRDMETYNKSVEDHRKWQLAEFNQKKKALIDSANEYKTKEGDLWKWEQLMNEAEKMKFQFDKSTNSISFGNCKLKDKSISFIPNTLQLETQDCFKHRRDHLSLKQYVETQPVYKSIIIDTPFKVEDIYRICYTLKLALNGWIEQNYPTDDNILFVVNGIEVTKQ